MKRTKMIISNRRYERKAKIKPIIDAEELHERRVLKMRAKKIRLTR